MTTSDASELHAQVAQVLQTVLRIPVTSDAVLNRSDTAAWDSLRQVELALFLEERFTVRFSAAEISTMVSSAVIVDILSLKLA